MINSKQDKEGKFSRRKIIVRGTAFIAGLGLIPKDSFSRNNLPAKTL